MPNKSHGKTINNIGKENDGRKKKTSASRIKNNLRVLVSRPGFNVAALVLLFLAVFAGLRYLRGQQTSGQIKFIEQPNSVGNELPENELRVYSSPEIFNGEVYDTSIRLREAGALGMAISLAVFTIGAEQGIVPPNLEKIWAVISERNLMPPGLEMKNGELLSPSGKIVVRYQSAPLRFEILSFARQNTSRPALLIRFPLNRLDGRTITFFQSSSAGAEVVPPPPFAVPEKIVSEGWTLEQWRGEIMPKTENPERTLQEEKASLERLPVN